MSKTNRNDPCTCGSGKKYKKCCGLKEAQKAQRRTTFQRGMQFGSDITAHKNLTDSIIKVIKSGDTPVPPGMFPGTSEEVVEEVVQNTSLEGLPDEMLPPPKVSAEDPPPKSLS